MIDDVEEYDEVREAEAIRQDHEMQIDTVRRIESMVDLSKELITPSKIKASPYHELIGKDLKISNLTREDVATVQLWIGLINQLVNAGLVESARVMHSELVAYLAAHSSINGFERRALITSINKIFKSSDDAPAKRRWGFK